MRNKIAGGVPAEILNELISEELFERDYTEIRREIEEFRGGGKNSEECKRYFSCG